MIAATQTTVSQLYRQAVREYGYGDSFGKFAEFYNRNKDTAAKGLEALIAKMKQSAVPETRIAGMKPVVAGVVGVTVILLTIGATGYLLSKLNS